MEQVTLPMLLVSKVLGTVCQTQPNSVRALHKIYCVAVWCLLNYVSIQVVQEERRKIISEELQTTTSENIIISYSSLIFTYLIFVFNGIALYVAIFGNNKLDGLISKLKMIAEDLKCEVRVAKKACAFLTRYIATFIAGTLLCLYQEFATWKDELRYKNRLILEFASTTRMVWQEIQLTTFAYTTCLLFKEINSVWSFY